MNKSEIFEGSPGEFLRGVFRQRNSKNQLFSLRSLARVLKMSPSHLSFVMRGKRRLSVESAEKVGELLNLPPQDREKLILKVELDNASSPTLKAMIRSRIPPNLEGIEAISREAAAFLLDPWFVIPIVEILHSKIIEPSPSAIANRLSIATEQVEKVIEVASSLRIIERDESGNWKKSILYGRILCIPGLEDKLRASYLKLNEIIQARISSRPASERYLGNEVFAMDPALLPEARALIDEFFNRFLELVKTGKNPKEIYVLEANLVGLTIPEKLPVEGVP